MSRSGATSCAIVVFVLMCVSVPVLAESHPVQLSLFNPIQIFPEEDEIRGIRFNLLYGKNTSVTGVDFGLVNHCTEGRSKAWQFGVVGYVEADFVGWQDHCVNVVKGNFKGFQSGFFNSAGYAKGFQLGIVNYAESMNGLQIGLVNIIRQGGAFPVFPIVNWSF